MIIHIKMSEVQVEVRNAAGDLIGSFSDAARFRKWRAQMQKERGEKTIAVGIADQLIIDTPSLMSRLPPGRGARRSQASWRDLFPYPKASQGCLVHN